VLGVLAYELAATFPEVRLIILDEPLAHLDGESMQAQIQMFQRMQGLPSAPSLLVISHLFIKDLTTHLKQAQVIAV
jgi:ABC-type molybdenum transport system ATPase subunit/photorepair protein PhrA